MGLPAKELTLLGSGGSNPFISASSLWCNGNTLVFGTSILGSSPSKEAINKNSQRSNSALNVQLVN